VLIMRHELPRPNVQRYRVVKPKMCSVLSYQMVEVMTSEAESSV
jgi:hypothetical protein